jgi:hypothetical protein
MTVSEFTCIALGMLFNVLTFFLGTAVGVTLCHRKDSDNDDRNRNCYEAQGCQFYDPPAQE